MSANLPQAAQALPQAYLRRAKRPAQGLGPVLERVLAHRHRLLDLGLNKV